jgi:hypothetical protein
LANPVDMRCRRTSVSSRESPPQCESRLDRWMSQ